MISRRDAVRRATLMVFGMSLQQMTVVQASPGQLTVDLDQWGEIVFKHRGKTVRVPVAEVFAALADGRT